MMMVDIDDHDVDKVKTIEWRFYSCFVVFLSVGENQTKSKADDLESTLQSYKKNPQGVYFCLLETAKLIQSLRKFLEGGQLDTEEALWEAHSLLRISMIIHSKPSCLDFLVDVHGPKLLTEFLRSFYLKHPNIFSPVEQVGTTNLAEIFYE